MTTQPGQGPAGPRVPSKPNPESLNLKIFPRLSREAEAIGADNATQHCLHSHDTVTPVKFELLKYVSSLLSFTIGLFYTLLLPYLVLYVYSVNNRL